MVTPGVEEGKLGYIWGGRRAVWLHPGWEKGGVVKPGVEEGQFGYILRGRSREGKFRYIRSEILKTEKKDIWKNIERTKMLTLDVFIPKVPFGGEKSSKRKEREGGRGKVKE